VTAGGRALGAVRFVDATTRVPVLDTLQVSAPGARFVRNHSGILAITGAPGLDGHVEALGDPPAQPVVTPFDLVIAVDDPTGRYLPRSTRMTLPRDPLPAHAAQPDSIFFVPQIALYPSPIARRAPGWAVVRASIRRAGPGGAPLPWCYFRLRRATASPTAEPLARGMSDRRGEAFVAVSGIPVTNWEATGTGPVLSSEIDAVLEAYFDPSHDPEAGTPPDPDAIDLERAALPSATTSLKLASGREVAVRLEITVPTVP
jgi:hypothetical protein